MRKYSQRSLDNLEGVHPDLRRVIDRALRDSPLDFIVIEGLRTKERQKELVAKGASKTMNSRHLTGHAVDLLPIDPKDGKGKFEWDLYDVLGPAVEKAAVAEGVPLVWGGRWKSFKDGPHFELHRELYPAGQPFPAAEPVVNPAPVDYVKKTPEPFTNPGAKESGRSIWALIAGLLATLFSRKGPEK